MSDELRCDLNRLVRDLLQERVRAGQPVADLLRGHLGDVVSSLPVVSEQLDLWDLPNLQLALESRLAEPGHESTTVALVGQAKRYAAFVIGDFLADGDWVPDVGPPEFINVPVGPDRTLPCLEFAIVLLTAPGGRSGPRDRAAGLASGPANVRAWRARSGRPSCARALRRACVGRSAPAAPRKRITIPS